MLAAAEERTSIAVQDDADPARLAEDLGLAIYAALCAEALGLPEDFAEACAQLKTTERAFMAVDGFWRARFEEDASLKNLYRALFNSQRAQLALLRRR